MARQRKSNSSRRAVQNVRIMDDYSGADGAKFDRVMSSLQNSHSQISLLCSEEYTIDVPTSLSVGKISQSQIRVMDDFVSLAQQFQTYRIKRVRFDIYDVFPGTGPASFFSTFHDVNTTGTQYVPTIPAVIDGPDSQCVAPGTGKLTLVWTAKGVAENEFQSTTSSAPVIQDFGGLRYGNFGSSTAVSGKYQVFCKAIVDFRGRS